MADVEYNETDVKYIAAIYRHPDPIVTVTEIADVLDVSQQAAYDRMEDLAARDLLTKKKVGSKAAVWWLTTDGVGVYREEVSGNS